MKQTARALATALERQPVRRRRALGLVAGIKKDLSVISERYWLIGDKLRAIQDGKLYASLEHKTFDAFLRAEVPEIANQADKMIAISRHFVRRDTAGIGLEKARALITYARARGDTDPGALIREDAPIGNKTVETASVREIRAAVRVLRDAEQRTRAKRRRAKPVDDDAADLVTALRDALRQAGLGRADIALRADRVQVTFAFGALRRRLAKHRVTP